MNEMADRLQTLKANLPVNCTRANVVKLQSRFLEYQLLVAHMEPDFESLQLQHKNAMSQLKLKIDAIDYHGDSLKLTRHHFKEAVHTMQHDIDLLIEKLNTQTS